MDLKAVVVTEVNPDLHMFVQFVDDGDKLEALTNDLRRELAEHPPLTGAYTPKKGKEEGQNKNKNFNLWSLEFLSGAICAARFSADNEWYRAKVEKELPDKLVQVLFIDYGNREIVKASKCAALPSVSSVSANPFAKEFVMACVTLPSDVSI